MYDIMQSTAHPQIEPNAAFQRILDAVEVLKEYDGKDSDIPGEAYAHLMLGLEKAPRGTAGYDFTDANGRRVQVKTKVPHTAWSDQLVKTRFVSNIKPDLADDLIIVFCNNEGQWRHIGPVAIADLPSRPHKAGPRYFLKDIVNVINGGARGR